MLLIKCCCCLCEHAVAGASVAAVTVAVAVATLGSDTTNTGSDTSGAFVVIICVCSVFVLLLVAVVSVLSGTEAVAWAAADCVWYSEGGGGGGGGSVAVVSVIRYSPLDDDMLSLARAFLYSVSLSGAITFPSPSKTYGLFGCSSQRSMKFFRLSFVVSNSFVCQMKKIQKQKQQQPD